MEENQVQEIEDDPIEVRKAKRAAIIEAGGNPYGHAFDYSHRAADIDEAYAQLADGESTEDAVRMCGRVMAKRVQGKVSFFTMRFRLAPTRTRAFLASPGTDRNSSRSSSRVVPNPIIGSR